MVIGSADAPAFASYELQYGISHDPGAFSAPFVGPVGNTVIDNVLGQWDTTGLSEGPHTLRLLVRDQAGAEREARVRLFVMPAGPVPDDPEPTATATIETPVPLPSPTDTPPVAVPPTATTVVEVPTATPVPTNTPLPTDTPPAEVPTPTWTVEAPTVPTDTGGITSTALLSGTAGLTTTDVITEEAP